LVLDIILTLIKQYPNVRVLSRTHKEIKSLRSSFAQKSSIPKLAVVDGKVFISPNLQAWPSSHFHRNFLMMAKKQSGQSIQLAEEIRLVLLSITKRCLLRCKHCYEGGNLGKEEILSLDELKVILAKLQSFSIPHFQLGGGEPMMRYDDLISLLEFADKNMSDFWITSCGYGISYERALALKKAGLIGVAISLDHYDADKHNEFRKHPKAYEWAKEAIENANKAGLVTSLNVCVTKEFCSMENMLSYAELAKDWGVAFIQILEARDAGGFKGRNAELEESHHEILEAFYFMLNQDKKYRKYPIAHYYSFRQRVTGCNAAGQRYMYVDTDGYINTCPFCRKIGGHVLKDDLNTSIQQLRQIGCQKYRSAI
jgi:MoaA/NifB/PqqE/SkfB family radical SAM enzyme